MSETTSDWRTFRNTLQAGDFDAAGLQLNAMPALLRMTNGIGETALHFLAVENDAASVAWLHARSADIDTKNKFGIPVIFEVAQLGYKDLFLWFVQQGVDLSATNSDGHRLVEHLLEYDKKDMAAWIRANGFTGSSRH